MPLVMPVGSVGVQAVRVVPMIEGHASSLSSDGRALLLLAKQILQLEVIEGPDLLAQVVEQFEDGERLLGRPGDGDVDGERTRDGLAV